MLMGARSDAEKNWLMYGRDYSNQRWSPLSQITTANVGALRVTWIYQTGIPRLGSFETSPIVVDGIMYVTTPYDTAMAVDARTGAELWRYEHKSGTTIPPRPEQSWRGDVGATWSTWRRSTRAWWPSTPRRAT